MNLDELLSFKPQQKLGKRSLDEQGTQESRPVKVPRVEDHVFAGSNGPPDLNGATDEEKLRLLQNLDDSEDAGNGLDHYQLIVGVF